MISLDPALNYCGVAIWHDDTGELAHAATIKGHDKLDCVDGWDYIATRVAEHLEKRKERDHVLVYEMPQLIAEWRKGDPNAILQVAGGLGTIARALIPFRRGGSIPVRPSEWTKSKAKDVNHRKMWRRLNAYEQEKLSESFGLNNAAMTYLIQYGDVADFEHALDAVCVGLYHQGRFEKY